MDGTNSEAANPCERQARKLLAGRFGSHLVPPANEATISESQARETTPFFFETGSII